MQTRLVDPLVRRVLRTPWHDLISRWVVLLAFTGRRSGATVQVPAQYAQDGRMLTLVSKRSRVWWRSLEGGAPLRLTLRGVERTGWADVSRDPERVRPALLAVGRAIGRDEPVMPVEEAVAVTVRLDPLDPEAAAEPRPADGRLWRRWFAAVTLGEILGFAVPALIAAAVTASDAGPLSQAAAIVAAGTVEGAVLGLAQAYALRTALPAVPTRDWVRATAGGAAVAWLIGCLPLVAGDRFTQWPPVLLVLLGTVLLASMGVLQWRVLRRQVSGAAWWVAATAGAWLAALGVFAAVTTPLWQEGQPAWLVAVIGLLGGVTMAATVAALTGLAILRLLVAGQGVRRHAQPQQGQGDHRGGAA
ncbi:hypothetical protein ACFOWE_07830 [Planomonospora corallina]|uniref:Nitroreductase family deazaflavin-dependent oxidoreductase n=1 Tax=Planomonospora corallina TaxID=1806052 RepID=A0ABV8I6Z7_9ACTN